jgi:SAM-dependent methyltransferase
LKEHHIQSVVDFGCGDWEFSKVINWDGISYTGFDVIAKLIDRNGIIYGNDHIQFYKADGLDIDLPRADLLICKDVLQHLNNEDVHKFITQIYKYKYCLITNDLGEENDNIVRGQTRGLDLTKPPFNVSGVKVLRYQSDTKKEVLLISQKNNLQ